MVGEPSAQCPVHFRRRISARLAGMTAGGIRATAAWCALAENDRTLAFGPRRLRRRNWGMVASRTASKIALKAAASAAAHNVLMLAFPNAQLLDIAGPLQM